MLSLGDKEYQFACIVWKHQPVSSSDLVKLSSELLGWKKSTMYTVLKKFIDKGIAENNASMVAMLIPKEQVDAYESTKLIEKVHQGSLPKFFTSFLRQKSITTEEIAEIEALMAQYRKENPQ